MDTKKKIQLKKFNHIRKCEAIKIKKIDISFKNKHECRVDLILLQVDWEIAWLN